MKKFLLFPAFALLLTGCVNDKSDNDLNGSDYGDPVRSFLSVSLVSPHAMISRDEVTSSTTPPTFVDGYPSENAINKVRFFFFDANGDPAEVNKQGSTNEYLSYIDWIPNESDIQKPTDNQYPVEKIAVANLGINQPPKVSEPPALILVVINPTGDVNQDFSTNPSLSTLRGYVKDYYTGLTDNNFVMSNSVYADNIGRIDATPLSSDNFQLTPEDAALPKNQLVVYVERVLARIDLSIVIEGGIENPQTADSNNKLYMYPTKSKDYTVNGSITKNEGSGNEETIPSQDSFPIYVQFLGWNVTSVPSASRLIKDINPNWNENLFEDTKIIPWNDLTYHRSYWAINPQISEFNYQFGNFNGDPDPQHSNYFPANSNPMPAPSTDQSSPFVTAYMQENAAINDSDATDQDSGSGAETPNKVILAAQLVNVNGDPITLVHWANRYYTENGVLLAVANSLNLYRKTTNESNTTFTRISPEYLQIVAADQVAGLNSKDTPQYYVFVQLTKAGEEIIWFNGNSEDATQLNLTQANNYILDRVNYMYMWKDGFTYYYFDIRHLGTEGNPGYFGVVRNHLYKANITKVQGLGTPVYNPDEVIYPEIPGYDDSVISAQIQVLQWRVVTQDYDLIWP